MATTSLWAVNGNIKNVIEYASNKEKTETSDDLSNVLNYASNNLKTNQLVSGVNCSPQNVLAQMKQTKASAGKEDGVQAFHGYQSFAPGEVDAVTCHKIGLETARRMWGDDFEVLVCTHTNTDNMHNHFVVNSVSWTTGKRFLNKHSDYRRFMKISDDVCREYGLSIIENPIGSRMNYKEYKKMIEEKPYLRGMVKEDVELAINGSRTMTQFYSNMKQMGYKFKDLKRKYLTVITPEGKNVRLDNIGYSKEKINNRILDNEQVRWSCIYTESYIVVTIHNYKQYKEHNKLHGLKALYVKYQFMLGILPKNDKPKPVHPSIREDLLYLDKLSKEAEFIEKHPFESLDELRTHTISCENELAALEAKRHALHSKRTRAKDPNAKEEIKLQIEELNKSIHSLNDEIDMCEDIEIRSTKIEQKLSLVEEELNKEKSKKEQERA